MENVSVALEVPLSVCIKTVNVQTNRYSFFSERLAVRL